MRGAVAVGLLLGIFGMVAAPAGAIQWYTGQRAFGKVTVEPAIDDMTGNQVFLLTPNNAPLPSKAAEKAQADLFLVAYPAASTVTNLNCTPTTCDHVQSFPFPSPAYPGGVLKGHDHLVGIANTGGDYNVAWDVELVFFTPQGVSDGAINHRIMTLAEIQAAETAGDAAEGSAGIVFNCSKVAITTYLHATPLSF